MKYLIITVFMALSVVSFGQNQRIGSISGRVTVPGGFVADGYLRVALDTTDAEAPNGSEAYLNGVFYGKVSGVWVAFAAGSTVFIGSETIYHFQDSTNTPPVSFPVGPDTIYYMIGGAGAGIFSGNNYKIAVYVNEVFDSFITPSLNDWGLVLTGVAQNTWHQYDGSTWPRRNRGPWSTEGNYGGGILGSTNANNVYFRYNNQNRIILNTNGVQFPSLTGAGLGIAQFSSAGFMQRSDPVASSDTAAIKPLGEDADGVLYRMESWPGGGGGIASLSAIGSSPNANSATITGSVLNLEPASASFGGVLTAGTQDIAGLKTFTSTGIGAPNLATGATTDLLTVWNATDGFRQISPAIYSKFILNQYATQQTANFWVDSGKAVKFRALDSVIAEKGVKTNYITPYSSVVLTLSAPLLIANGQVEMKTGPVYLSPNVYGPINGNWSIGYSARNNTSDPSQYSGRNVTIQANQAVISTTNTQGGDLLLKSGGSTGNAVDSVLFYTSTPGASGTADNPVEPRIVVSGHTMNYVNDESSFYTSRSVVDKAYVDAVAGGGGVTSVSGTSGRITSTGGATPAIDIDTDLSLKWDSSYSIDVFLIAGQSNALPQGDSALSPKTKAGTAYQYYNNTILIANDPVGPTASGTGTAWPAFAIKYYNLTGKRICFVQTAVGSSSVFQANEPDNLTWDVGGDLFGESVTKTNAAIDSLKNRGFNPVFKGVLWVQGEEDAVNINSAIETQSQYTNALKTLIYNYRNTFNDSLGFYIFRTGTTTSGSDIGYDSVRQGEEIIADSIFNCAVVYAGTVDFPGRGFMDDNVHYNQPGANEMGYYGAENVVNGNEAKSQAIKTQTNKTGFGGVSQPSALIELAPNTTTLPAIRFGRNGTLLSTTKSFSLEATNAALFYTDSISGVKTRRQIPTLSNNNAFTGINNFADDITLANTSVDIGDATNYVANLYAFVVRGPTGVNLNIQSNAVSNAILFKRATTEDMRIAASGGQLLIKQTTNDGVNALQVTGGAKFSGGIAGSATNDNATAGYVGEEISAIQSTYTNYTTSATYQNITSITLTAGDWDLSAFFTYSSNSATITAASNAIFAISTTTASAAGATEGRNIAYLPQAALLGTSLFSEAISPYRVSISSTTTYYLNSQATFTLGNPQYVGGLRARRVR